MSLPSIESPAAVRRAHRREAIARACLERFSAEGLFEPRLDRLAEDAGLSKQALLFYFAEKADLTAEAVRIASEEVTRALLRGVRGEAGAVVLRALRRSLDEIARVLPTAFAVFLDARSSAVRLHPTQETRLARLQDELAETLARALGGSEGAARLVQLAQLTLLAHHQNDRQQRRAGRIARTALVAELDFAEDQLVSLASRRRAHGS